MLAFYEGIGIAYGVPVRICLASGENLNRMSLGWSEDEFSHLQIVIVGDSRQRAEAELAAHQNWHQLFGAYQSNAMFQHLILYAKSLGSHVGVCSEAPLNMFKPGLRRLVKYLYLSEVLPRKMKPFVAASDFVINLSGSDCHSFMKLGWRSEQILPCGYFPPPLNDTEFHKRDEHSRGDFHILCTGGMTWHRGQDVLVNALKLLTKWGVNCRVTMTQTGPLEDSLKQIAQEFELPIDFVGMVPMAKLIELMEQCDCYVATGREEPWGIRVNDALHCGTPVVVSRGMGACKIVDDFGCGMTFNKDDCVDLAWKLRRMILDRDYYLESVSKVFRASEQSMPHVVARNIVQFLQENFKTWSVKTKL
jgi:glycosyltransferase involved in cell wall biosynthesis